MTHDRTPSGDRALDEFEGLLAVTEQALDKSECLRWLNSDLADLPVAHLTDAQQAVSSSENTGAIEELFGELVMTDFDRYRGMITHVNNGAAHKFAPQIQNGVQSELLVTSNVPRNLPLTGIPATMVKSGLQALNFDMLMAPHIPVMMSIFDDEVVFLAPRPRDIQGDVSGAIVSSDDEVVGWAIELYEKCRKQSRWPSTHLMNSILNKLDPSPRFTGSSD